MRIVNTTILGSILLIFAVGAIVGLVGWRKYSAQFEAARSAQPLALPVDLSRPGIYRGIIDNRFALAHGQSLQLKVGPTTQPVIFSGLKATIHIEDEKHQTQIDQHITAQDLAIAPGGVVLLDMRSLPIGKNDLALEVQQPASGTAGATQTLVAPYEMCGLEEIPAQVFGLIAIGCTIAFLFFATILWIGRDRRAA